ncbi:MAG: EMC3/TMCO1 family protein [Candidatus Nanohaloarchaeota archaeon QJJ-9]|nr:EMC3/TMCO1 family protein [Candidatus Nanohaloarchaeota archaeon QJJ-9]
MSYPFLFGLFMGVVEPAFPVIDAIFSIVFSTIGVNLTSAQVTVGLISIIIAAIISVLYLLLMDQERHQEIKDKQKELQNDMKEARSEGEMDKANKYMSENMKLQKEMFKSMFKPMIASMFVFFLIIPYILHTFVPVVGLPQADNGFKGNFTMMDGRYNLEELEVERKGNSSYVLVHNNQTYNTSEEIKLEDMRWQVRDISVTEDESKAEVKLALEFLQLPVSLPLAGSSFEWLGFYILFQFPFTFIFRKLLGVQ